MIRVLGGRWFLVCCPGCRTHFSIPMDPRLVAAYTCPCCLTRQQGPPIHGQHGMGPEAAVAAVELGEGLYIYIPKAAEPDESE